LLDSLKEGGVGLEVTLSSKFSRKDKLDHLQVVASVAKGFEVHERDSHVHKLLIALYGLLLVP
jgi:hypothetical protein